MKTFEFQYIGKFLPTILSYLPITLTILTWVVLLSLLVGVILVVIRFKKIPVLDQLAKIILSYSRGVPEITQLFIMYYGLPKILILFNIDITRLDGIIFVILTYGVSVGTAVSENLRVAFSTIDKGQVEAALAIGLSPWTTFRRVMFPLAMELALPNYSNIIVRSLKNTSLAFSVGVVEMMTIGKQLGSTSLHPIEAFVSLSIIYYILYWAIIILFKWLNALIWGRKRWNLV